MGVDRGILNIGGVRGNISPKLATASYATCKEQDESSTAAIVTYGWSCSWSIQMTSWELH